MYFDIVEAIRQKQRTYVRSISVENGDIVDITATDGTIVVSRRDPRGEDDEVPNA